jgi:hypothetical protein
VKTLKQLFQSFKVSFVMSAIKALDEQNCIGPVVSNTRDFLEYQLSRGNC